MKKILMLVIFAVLSITSFAKWEQSMDGSFYQETEDHILRITKGSSDEDERIMIISKIIRPVNCYGRNNVKITIDGGITREFIAKVEYEQNEMYITIDTSNNKQEEIKGFIDDLEQASFDIKMEMHSNREFVLFADVNDFYNVFNRKK